MPDGADAAALFEEYGRVPLPPYIKNRGVPDERYQTVYADARNARSAAAPTAGLHFTGSLMEELAAAGIEHTFITLDVGLGTFRPVKERDIRAHKMHTERCYVGEGAAEIINAARKASRRVIAVGTTVTRTLESMTDGGGVVRSGAADTDIFIYPGYRFRAVDALITNFHLPCSTLLMLVAAFAGYGATMAAYAEAVRERYRFFSFGDAMLIE
jgi:S-adenosylmethionine:tRNA ribosyltransferase-isomerase